MPTLVDKVPVFVEHDHNMGFVEGAGNRNPWSEEIGAGDAAYCISAACIVAYHHGVRWWNYSQFGEKGYAYCPYFRTGAMQAGIWAEGHNVDLQVGDLVLYSWGNNGVADHCETVRAIFADGTFQTWGYNAGHPEGAHIITRDRKYLLGRGRMVGNFYYNNNVPVQVPATNAPAVQTPPAYVSGETMRWLVQIKNEDGHLEPPWWWTDFLGTRSHCKSAAEASTVIAQEDFRAGGPHRTIVRDPASYGPFVINAQDPKVQPLAQSLRQMTIVGTPPAQTHDWT